MKKALLLLVLLALAAVGCAPTDVDTDSADATDASGPPVTKGGAGEVWSADNAWSDTDTTAAKKAGIAWEENSGLSWEEKYGVWLSSLETIPSASGWGTTISIKTPWGDKTLPGPTLECAEVAMTLRATFASWYHLPFFLKGWDAENHRWFYAGHFGFVDGSGHVLSGFPGFKGKYKDYEKGWKPGDAWPSDPTLRLRHLGANDTVTFLSGPNGEEVGAGAYFDELYLNKRTGYFMRLMLLYFGSANLADGANMFHIAPDAVRAGDVLLERWQKEGIGHTIPVLRVTSPIEGKLAIEIATGSMPRRQPKYEDALQSRYYFTMNATGGEGNASDGTPYAKLGGGIRRWRVATPQNGRWTNAIPKGDSDIAISDKDLEGIAARPKEFDALLITGSPDEQVIALTAKIQGAREHLLEHPSSCSARETREKAFEALYSLAPQLGKSAEDIDAELRTTDDYVFGELEYEKSKTCCWNSTTPAMAEIILDLAREEKEAAEAEGVCRAPTVFRAQADGYAVWADHAAKMGRASDWLDWSEDEPCAQKEVAEDAIAASEAQSFCPAN